MKYLSPILSDARASIGGATASKNRAGNYFRARVAPVQPRTVPQQVQRAILSTYSAAWRSLSESDRAGWSALAAQITLKDSLGNSYQPTGAQLYVGNNANLVTAGESPVTTAPALKPDFPDITPVAAAPTAGTPAFAITTAATAAPTGNVFIVRATPQLSPGISFIGKSRFRYLENFAATAYASLDILTGYNDTFGTLVAGTNIGFSVSLLNIATGFMSIESTGSAIVGA